MGGDVAAENEELAVGERGGGECGVEEPVAVVGDVDQPLLENHYNQIRLFYCCIVF